MSTVVSRRAVARVVAAKLLGGRTGQASVMRSLAAYMLENKLADDADVLINDIAEELFMQSGRLTVEVTSARPLPETARDSLRGYLGRQTGALAVDLHETVDTDLVGGLIARTPSAELDTSIRSKLRQLTAMSG